MTKTEPTIQDVLEAISEFSIHVDDKFEKIESDIGGLKSEVGSLKSEVGSLKSEVGSLRKEMERGFEDLHAELRSVREELEQVRMRLQMLERWTQEDTGALTKEYLGLKDRVAELEQKVHRLELAQQG